MKKIFLLTILILSLMITGCTISTPPAEQPIAQEQKAEELEPIDLDSLEATVPILIYHHIRPIVETDSQEARTFIVGPQSFEQQLEYLAENNFETISLNDLVDYFSGTFDLPEKPVIITFDDGNINQYNNAFPILKKYNFKATFFLFANPIGHSANYLNWEQVKEMSDAGMEIGSHGWYHKYLTKISLEELSKEINASKEIIEENLDQEIKVFSYPFGLYDESVTKLIKEAGYLAARDIINGKNHTNKDLYSLRGYFITENISRFLNIIK